MHELGLVDLTYAEILLKIPIAFWTYQTESKVNLAYDIITAFGQCQQ